MIPLFIDALSNKLKTTLPGWDAQKKMMIIPNRFSLENDENKGKPASVLLLLYPSDKGWFFFLTIRSQKVEHHKGQISLPGGVVKDNESNEGAAIRETNEEIGVEKNIIKIIGGLTSFYVPISNFRIFPYVGWTNKKPRTKVQDSEVERIFSVSINDLMLDNNLKLKQEIFSDQTVTIPYFDLGGEVVWGATSMILSEFKIILRGMK
tara:strand:- start:1615 stop:2235 length:621 start_codon:yes stop_codon:yes gene_type:complete